MPAATEPAGGAHRSDGDARVDSARVRAFVLAATVLASAMAFIDGSVVTIALPVIQTEFAARFQALQWVVNAYTLMLGALILVGGALGDRVGRRRVFVVGIAIFAAASLTCALAASVKMLIAARAVQGLGAALLVPQSLAIIAASFPRAVRGRAIGVWAAASAITTSLGPPLGGFVIDTWSWRAAFLINLPLSAAALLLAFTHVPESRDRSATGRLDWPGSLLAVLSLGALTYGLTQLSGRTSGTGLAPAALIVAAVGFVAFWRVERRARNPILPAVLFRSRTFLAANVLTLFLYGALAGVLFLLPFDLIARRGMAASAVGLTLLPFSLIIGLLSRSAGGLADRFGARNLLVGGSLVAAAAILCVALDLSNYWLGIFVPITAMALGMAAVVTPLTTVVMNAASDAQSGAASGVNNAASRIAGLVSVAILGALAGSIFTWRGAPADARFGELPAIGSPLRHALEQAFLSAYSGAMGVAAVLAAAAAATAFFGLSKEACRGHAPEQALAARQPQA
jgi:EmrB/QacA subfamily drug resistance transporter